MERRPNDSTFHVFVIASIVLSSMLVTAQAPIRPPTSKHELQPSSNPWRKTRRRSNSTHGSRPPKSA